jgi:hypothetical protein
MFSGNAIGDAIQGLFVLVAVLGVLAIFGIWKLVEIGIWLFSHVSIAVT